MRPAAALPLILLAAVVQGWVLYGLHHAIDAGAWPATSPALLFALYAVAVYVPLTIQVLAGEAVSRTVWLFLAAAAAAFFGFGLHEGGFVRGDEPGDPELGPLLFLLALIWLQLLPFVQGRLATGRWRPEYPRLFAAACRNVLVLGEAAVFTGLFWLLLFLWQALFALLGISFFRELFRELVFIYPVTALTFGIALHLIGSLDRLTATVLDQALGVLKWLAVPGTFILAIFSLALIVKLPRLLATGDWAVGAEVLLWLVAVVVLLLNAAYRDGSDPAPYPAWLGLAIRGAVPLAVLVSALALYALFLRTGQYGLTIERWWGFVVAATALLVSAGYARAAFRGGPWMQGLAPVNVVASLALMGVIALSLTPLLSPARLAAESQFERALTAPPAATNSGGRASPIEWLRFQGGGYGRARLRELAALGEGPGADGIRRAARAALEAADPPALEAAAARAALATLPVFPRGRVLTPDLRAALEASPPEPARPVTSPDGAAGTAGLYLDVDGDGQEEFLLLSAGNGVVYARQDDGWVVAGQVVADREAGEPDGLLVDLAAGAVVEDRRWKDIRLGGRRLTVVVEE